MDIKKIFINCMIVLCIGVIALSVVTVVKREKEPKAEAVVSQDITKNEEIVFDTENIEDTEIEESIEDEAEDIETKIMYANSKVNVRTGPGTNYEKVVELQRGAEIVTVGELDENGWQLIDYEGQEAYILGRYLSEEMPVVTPVTPTTPDGTTTTP